MEEIINDLIQLKENYGEQIDEIICDNMNNTREYKDLTQAEIKEINKYRKKIKYIYDVISLLNIIKESD